MKRNIPDIFLGALMAVVVFAMGAVFSYSIQAPINQPQQAKSDQTSDDGTVPISVSKTSDPNERIADYTLALVILTVVTAVATGGLWYIAVLTARRQLRAYISVVGADLEEAGEDGLLRFVVQIRNAGQTPAFDTIDWTGTGIAPYPRDRPFLPPPTRDIHKMVLGPGCDSFLRVTKRVAPTDVEWSEIQQRTKALYVYGRLEYLDAFKRPRFTNFAFTYTRGTVTQGLRRYKEHNDAS